MGCEGQLAGMQTWSEINGQIFRGIVQGNDHGIVHGESQQCPLQGESSWHCPVGFSWHCPGGMFMVLFREIFMALSKGNVNGIVHGHCSWHYPEGMFMSMALSRRNVWETVRRFKVWGKNIW